jgi:WXG100 family type VII secretion target
MGTLRVDYPVLRRVANQVRATGSDLSRDLAMVTGVVDELAAAWTGSGADRFAEIAGLWREDAQRLLDELAGMGDLLDRCAASYEAVEGASASSFDSIVNTLNPRSTGE